MCTTSPPSRHTDIHTDAHTQLKVGSKVHTKASNVCCSLLGKCYNRFRSGSGVFMPTSQKSSLNSHMNLTTGENAGVSTLMGLSQHHQCNTIHELPESVDRLKTQMFTMLNFCTKKCVLVSVILLRFSFFSLSDSLALIPDGAQCQSICQIYFTDMMMNYGKKQWQALKDRQVKTWHTLSSFVLRWFESYLAKNNSKEV